MIRKRLCSGSGGFSTRTLTDEYKSSAWWQYWTRSQSINWFPISVPHLSRLIGHEDQHQHLRCSETKQQNIYRQLAEKPNRLQHRTVKNNTQVSVVQSVEHVPVSILCGVCVCVPLASNHPDDGLQYSSSWPRQPHTRTHKQTHTSVNRNYVNTQVHPC